MLVRAENPMNIGQAARAMKNFGVSKLTLVDCVPHRVPDAFTTGWKARNILNQARSVKSLANAIKGSLAVGFTSRAGKRRGTPRAFFDVVPEILGALEHQKVALLFGNEKNGLSNEELKRCHWIATIPAAPEYTSLNLSHAVAVVLATLYGRHAGIKPLFEKPARYYVKPAEFERFMRDWAQILRGLRYRNSGKHRIFSQVITGFRHYFKKAGLDRRELHLFQAFASKIRQKI